MNTKTKRPRGKPGFWYWVKRGFPGEWHVMETKRALMTTGSGEYIYTASNRSNALRMVNRLTSEAYYSE